MVQELWRVSILVVYKLAVLHRNCKVLPLGALEWETPRAPRRYLRRGRQIRASTAEPRTCCHSVAYIYIYNASAQVISSYVSALLRNWVGPLYTRATSFTQMEIIDFFLAPKICRYWEYEFGLIRFTVAGSYRELANGSEGWRVHQRVIIRGWIENYF